MNSLPKSEKLINQVIFDNFIDAAIICEITLFTDNNQKDILIKSIKFNKAFCTQFNVKEGDIFDFNLFFRPQEIRKLRETMIDVIKTDQSMRITDFIYYSYKGGKIFNVDIIKFNNNALLLLFHDISSRLDLEQALLVAIKQIETAITIGNVIREHVDLDETLQKALKAAKEMVGGKYGAIFRVNKEKKFLELVSAIDLPQELTNIARIRPLGPKVPSFSGKSAYYNKTVVITDALSDLEDEETRIIFENLRITDVLNCPIPFESRALGVVQISRTDSWHFTAHEIRLLESFATWLGYVIMDASHREVEIKLRKEAEFFIDLMTHDLTNLNAISFACLEDLETRIDKMVNHDTDGFFFFQGLKKSLLRTQELVNNVRVLSIAREIKKIDFRKIDLVDSLKNSINRLKGLNSGNFTKIKFFNHQFGTYFVNATDLIDHLFVNIFLGVFDIFSHSNDNITITIEHSSAFYMIIFESSYELPLEISNRLLYGSIMNEIGGSRSDVSSIGHLIIKTLIEKYNGKMRIEYNWEPEIQSRVIINFPKQINI